MMISQVTVKSVVFAAVLALGAMISNVQASTIGVQFTGQQYTGTGSYLAAGDAAGLTGYESQNWNVFVGDLDGNATFEAPQLAGAALVDDGGNATSAAITTTGFDAVTLTGSPNNTPNSKLFKHGFAISAASATTPTVTVNGLAASGYGTYDLIVYLSKEFFQAGSNAQLTTLTVNGNAIPIQINHYTTSPPVTFEDATVIGAGNGGNVGNYVRVTGQTGDLTLALASASGAAVGINGFQIIAIPEPATLSLLAIGGLTMFARRRRA